ncbi:MAG: PAS domain S-box protein [Candidatus Manganitrophus sp.]|nr:PAS domain S-box protein [Candidatus Manganitrophus sp.]
MAMTAPNKGFIEVNDQLCKILGYERGELLQKTWEEMTCPDDLASDVALFNRVVAGEMDGYSIDKRFIHKDGRVIHGTMSVKCLRRGDGSIEYFVALLQDITERKQAEARLAYQANLLTHVGDAILATDDQLTLTAWNLAAEKIYGWKAEEVLGRKMYDAVRSELTDIQRSEALQAISEKGYYHADLVHTRKDGTQIHIQGYTIALRDESGRITGYVSANRDVTEHKRAEEALRAAKEFSENLIQTANVMILSLDTEGKIDIFNETAEKITGYTLLELKGKNWFEILVPKDRYPRVWEEFNRLLAGGTPKTFENPILTKTGEERYILWQNNQVKIDGKVVATISFGNDITEQKQAEEALRAEHAFRKAIEEAMPAGVMAVDSTGRQTYVNQSFCEMVGWSPEELNGATPPFIFWPPEQIDLICHIFENHMRGMIKPGPVELIFRRRNEERFPVSLLVSPLVDHPGSSGRLLGVGARHHPSQNIPGKIGAQGEATVAGAATCTPRKLELGPAHGHRHLVGRTLLDLRCRSEAIYSPVIRTLLQLIHPEDREAVEQATEKALRERLFFRPHLPDHRSRWTDADSPGERHGQRRLPRPRHLDWPASRKILQK